MNKRAAVSKILSKLNDDLARDGVDVAALGLGKVAWTWKDELPTENLKDAAKYLAEAAAKVQDILTDTNKLLARRVEAERGAELAKKLLSSIEEINQMAGVVTKQAEDVDRLPADKTPDWEAMVYPLSADCAQLSKKINSLLDDVSQYFLSLGQTHRVYALNNMNPKKGNKVLPETNTIKELFDDAIESFRDTLNAGRASTQQVEKGEFFRKTQLAASKKESDIESAKQEYAASEAIYNKYVEGGIKLWNDFFLSRTQDSSGEPVELDDATVKNLDQANKQGLASFQVLRGLKEKVSAWSEDVKRQKFSQPGYAKKNEGQLKLHFDKIQDIVNRYSQVTKATGWMPSSQATPTQSGASGIFD